MADKVSAIADAIGNAKESGRAPIGAEQRQFGPDVIAGDVEIMESEELLELLDEPDDFPVQCLGKNGNLHYYLDDQGQLIALDAPEHGRTHIVSLFGRRLGYLLERWGRKDRKGELTGGLHTDTISNVLMRSCARAGIIDPAHQVRGLGAWLGKDGGLVYHLGDTVRIDGEFVPPGRYGKHVYPAYAAAMRPHHEQQNLDPGAELLRDLKTWNWQHDAQAVLALGWIAQGFVVGALDWRTHMICDGERGSGKSALQKLLKGIYGNWLMATSNTSGPALYQLMGGRAQPIAIDEFEAGNNPQRKQQVVEILREASSGGAIARGGDNHVGRLFSVNFPAFLTSIVTISLLPADESRMVRGALRELPEGAVPPDLSEARLGPLGSRIMRRVLDQWPRFSRTLEAYRAALAQYAKMDARLQDTYGTLLACADLLLSETAPTVESLRDAIGKIGAMVAPARAESLGDQERCIDHLLVSQIDVGGGTKRTIASWVRQTQALDEHLMPHLDLRQTAVRALASVGLRVDDLGTEPGGMALFISNTNPALSRIFEGTPWPGGAGAMGSWVGVLRRLPGAHAPKIGKKINGHTVRGTYVPLSELLDWIED